MLKDDEEEHNDSLAFFSTLRETILRQMSDHVVINTRSFATSVLLPRSRVLHEKLRDRLGERRSVEIDGNDVGRCREQEIFANL